MESINTGVEFYSNVKASEVEWVWYPYIPCGKITMLQGDPGEGKSTLIIHVAAILEYLQKLLSVEDLASTYIYEKMKEYGIAKRTVQEAKKIAEIKAYKKGKIWYWHMEVGDSI